MGEYIIYSLYDTVLYQLEFCLLRAAFQQMLTYNNNDIFLMKLRHFSFLMKLRHFSYISHEIKTFLLNVKMLQHT